MTPEERERMNRLCAQIQVEQDHNKFTQLIAELNSLFETKERRLDRETTRTQMRGHRCFEPSCKSLLSSLISTPLAFESIVWFLRSRFPRSPTIRHGQDRLARWCPASSQSRKVFNSANLASLLSVMAFAPSLSHTLARSEHAATCGRRELSAQPG